MPAFPNTAENPLIIQASIVFVIFFVLKKCRQLKTARHLSASYF